MVEGCGNSVSKHLNAVYNSPPHYCWRASINKLGLGCCGLRKNTLQCMLIASHSLDDGHPTLYGKRMWRFCGWLISCNHFSTFRYGASSYMSMGMLAFFGKFIYMMLVAIHLRIADRRHPHVFSVVSATKVQRICDICKRLKEKWCYPLRNLAVLLPASKPEFIKNIAFCLNIYRII